MRDGVRYNESLALFKSSTQDVAWHASALEGLATIPIVEAWSSTHGVVRISTQSSHRAFANRTLHRTASLTTGTLGRMSQTSSPKHLLSTNEPYLLPNRRPHYLFSHIFIALQSCATVPFSILYGLQRAGDPSRSQPCSNRVHHLSSLRRCPTTPVLSQAQALGTHTLPWNA